MNINNVLKNLLANAAISASELSRQTGIAQPIIHRIINEQNNNPKLETMMAIANYFKITVSQLIGEIPLQDNISFKSSEKKSYTVPLINWDMVDMWVQTEFCQKRCVKILTNFPTNKSAYCLKTQDIAAEPVFASGTFLIVDPKKIAKNRNYVIMKIKKNSQIAIRQLLLDGNEKYLRTLNSELQNTPLQSFNVDDFRGTIIQSIATY